MISWLLLVLVPVAAAYFRTDFTAGNTKCRHDNKCGFHQGSKYSWCYTDYSDFWDYCCTDDCKYDNQLYFTCPSGDKSPYCSDFKTKDVSGRPCLESHPCGMHEKDGGTAYFWCYVDMDQNWGYCCRPNSVCSKNGMGSSWCYTSYEIEKFGVGSGDFEWTSCKEDE